MAFISYLIAAKVVVPSISSSGAVVTQPKYQQNNKHSPIKHAKELTLLLLLLLLNCHTGTAAEQPR
eukprot:9721-Heterococcus_DN1.PRE.2